MRSRGGYKKSRDSALPPVIIRILISHCFFVIYSNYAETGPDHLKHPAFMRQARPTKTPKMAAVAERRHWQREQPGLPPEEPEIHR